VLEKRRLDQALNAKEFAVLAGISYSTARKWFRVPGFPVFRGIVFWQDFVQWRAGQNGFKSLSPHTTTPTLLLPPQNRLRAPRKFFWTPDIFLQGKSLDGNLRIRYKYWGDLGTKRFGHALGKWLANVIPYKANEDVRRRFQTKQLIALLLRCIASR
jgi:hypothetical protein